MIKPKIIFIIAILALFIAFAAYDQAFVVPGGNISNISNYYNSFFNYTNISTPFNLTAGTGIILSPNPTTGNGTISINTITCNPANEASVFNGTGFECKNVADFDPYVLKSGDTMTGTLNVSSIHNDTSVVITGDGATFAVQNGLTYFQGADHIFMYDDAISRFDFYTPMSIYGDLNMYNHNITNCGNCLTNETMVHDDTKVNKSGDTMTGTLDMGNNIITGVTMVGKSTSSPMSFFSFGNTSLSTKQSSDDNNFTFYTQNNRSYQWYTVYNGIAQSDMKLTNTSLSLEGLNLINCGNCINNDSIKINITQINSLETWNSTFVNGSNAYGASLEMPLHPNPNEPTTTNAFFSPGGYEGLFGFGASELPLIRDSDTDPITGQYGYSVNTSGNYTLARMNDKSLRINVFSNYSKVNRTETQYLQDNQGFTFYYNNLSSSISVGEQFNPLSNITGGLNMNGERIQNSPDISMIWSTGVISGADITFNNTTGNISISGGTTMIRNGLIPTDMLFERLFNASIFHISYGETKYIYLDYLLGVTQLKETTNIADISGYQQIQVYQVFLNNEFHYIDARGQNLEIGKKLRSLLYDTNRFLHAQGGSMIGTPSGLNISVTAGRFYYGLNPINHNSLNTADNGTYMEYYYHNSTGAWFSKNISQINNTAYNPVGSGLITMSNTRYKVEWVYLTLSSDNTTEIDVIAGQNQYVTIGGATAELAPSNLPVEIRDISVLIGRVILQKNDITLISVESAFNTVYTPAAATNHNALSNLQGGNLNEYYHLNNSLYTNVLTYLTNFTLSVQNIINLNVNGFVTNNTVDKNYSNLTHIPVIVSSGNYIGDGTTNRFIPYSLNRTASKIDIFSNEIISNMGAVIEPGKIINYKTGVVSTVNFHNSSGFFVNPTYNKLSTDINIVGSSESTNTGANYARFNALIPNSSGTIINISLNVSSGASGALRFAIYNDTAGTVGTLINQTGDIPMINGLNDASLCVNVTQGTQIWIVFNTNSTTANWYMAATGVSSKYKSLAYGAFPSTITGLSTTTTLNFMSVTISGIPIQYFWNAV